MRRPPSAPILATDELDLQSFDNANSQTEAGGTLVHVEKLPLVSFGSFGHAGQELVREGSADLDEEILSEDGISDIQQTAMQSETKNLAGKLRSLMENIDLD